MRVVVTGAKGLIGSALVERLKNSGHDVLSATRDTNMEELCEAVETADALFHLAGTASTGGKAEDYAHDIELAKSLASSLKESGERQSVILASSVWATGEGRFAGSPYSAAKREIETIFESTAGPGMSVTIFRMSNVFGRKHPNKKGTAVANFCEAVASGNIPEVNDPSVPLRMSFIDDAVDSYVRALEDGSEAVVRYLEMEPAFETTVGELAEAISSFSGMREDSVEFAPDSLEARLYEAYLSYL